MLIEIDFETAIQVARLAGVTLKVMSGAKIRPPSPQATRYAIAIVDRFRVAIEAAEKDEADLASVGKRIDECNWIPPTPDRRPNSARRR